MNSKQVGDTTEVKILSRFIETGYSVSIPWGDNDRYDMIVDMNGHLVKIQCKTARDGVGGIEFSTVSSSTHRTAGKKRNYKGQVDYFAVYSSTTFMVYLIPISDISHGGSMKLRIEPTRNNQEKRINWAKDYIL